MAGGDNAEGAGSSSGGAGEENVNSVSLTTRISDFWPKRPRIWFQYTENILASQRLGDEAKFNIMVHKLGPDVVQHISDLLLTPPATGKCDALKERLLYIYEESENRQVQKLISELELGDQKPSQLLLRMRELARDKIKDETLSILWQGHLPPSVRAVLAVADTKNLNSLAAVADKVMENTKSVFVSEVSQSNEGRDFPVDDIRREIAQIHQEIKSMRNQGFRSRSRSRGRDQQQPVRRNRSRAATPSGYRTRRSPACADWLCFYHFKFGGDAQKCAEPCAWKRQQHKQQQQGN